MNNVCARAAKSSSKFYRGVQGFRIESRRRELPDRTSSSSSRAAPPNVVRRGRRELREKYDDSLVGLSVETLLFAVTAATGKRRSGFKSLLEKK
ncbi:unnamed protein product [Sphagnum jensenii]|uniref:Uncharacterized protein n=1 Tax=Sphagnum jensenii TaxID=128206 RepID=A0ABP0VK84_9BRYO